MRVVISPVLIPLVRAFGPVVHRAAVVITSRGASTTTLHSSVNNRRYGQRTFRKFSTTGTTNSSIDMSSTVKSVVVIVAMEGESSLLQLAVCT